MTGVEQLRARMRERIAMGDYNGARRLVEEFADFGDLPARDHAAADGQRASEPILALISQQIDLYELSRSDEMGLDPEGTIVAIANILEAAHPDGFVTAPVAAPGSPTLREALKASAHDAAFLLSVILSGELLTFDEKQEIRDRTRANLTLAAAAGEGSGSLEVAEYELYVYRVFGDDELNERVRAYLAARGIEPHSIVSKLTDYEARVAAGGGSGEMCDFVSTAEMRGEPEPVECPRCGHEWDDDGPITYSGCLACDRRAALAAGARPVAGGSSGEDEWSCCGGPHTVADVTDYDKPGWGHSVSCPKRNAGG